MNKKVVNKTPVTKEEVSHIVDVKIDDLDRKFEERFVQFKSDIFTRFDELIGELSQQREDRIFTDNDIKVLKEKSDEHETRIKKLETNPTSSQ